MAGNTGPGMADIYSLTENCCPGSKKFDLETIFQAGDEVSNCLDNYLFNLQVTVEGLSVRRCTCADASKTALQYQKDVGIWKYATENQSEGSVDDEEATHSTRLDVIPEDDDNPSNDDFEDSGDSSKEESNLNAERDMTVVDIRAETTDSPDKPNLNNKVENIRIINEIDVNDKYAAAVRKTLNVLRMDEVVVGNSARINSLENHIRGLEPRVSKSLNDQLNKDFGLLRNDYRDNMRLISEDLRDFRDLHKKHDDGLTSLTREISNKFMGHNEKIAQQAIIIEKAKSENKETISKLKYELSLGFLEKETFREKIQLKEEKIQQLNNRLNDLETRNRQTQSDLSNEHKRIDLLTDELLKIGVDSKARQFPASRSYLINLNVEFYMNYYRFLYYFIFVCVGILSGYYTHVIQSLDLLVVGSSVLFSLLVMDVLMWTICFLWFGAYFMVVDLDSLMTGDIKNILPSVEFGFIMKDNQIYVSGRSPGFTSYRTLLSNLMLYLIKIICIVGVFFFLFSGTDLRFFYGTTEMRLQKLEQDFSYVREFITGDKFRDFPETNDVRFERLEGEFESFRVDLVDIINSLFVEKEEITYPLFGVQALELGNTDLDYWKNIILSGDLGSYADCMIPNKRCSFSYKRTPECLKKYTNEVVKAQLFLLKACIELNQGKMPLSMSYTVAPIFNEAEEPEPFFDEGIISSPDDESFDESISSMVPLQFYQAKDFNLEFMTHYLHTFTNFTMDRFKLNKLTLNASGEVLHDFLAIFTKFKSFANYSFCPNETYHQGTLYFNCSETSQNKIALSDNPLFSVDVERFVNSFNNAGLIQHMGYKFGLSQFVYFLKYYFISLFSFPYLNPKVMSDCENCTYFGNSSYLGCIYYHASNISYPGLNDSSVFKFLLDMGEILKYAFYYPFFSSEHLVDFQHLVKTGFGVIFGLQYNVYYQYSKLLFERAFILYSDYGVLSWLYIMKELILSSSLLLIVSVMFIHFTLIGFSKFDYRVFLFNRTIAILSLFYIDLTYILWYGRYIVYISIFILYQFKGWKGLNYVVRIRDLLQIRPTLFLAEICYMVLLWFIYLFMRLFDTIMVFNFIMNSTLLMYLCFITLLVPCILIMCIMLFLIYYGRYFSRILENIQFIDLMNKSGFSTFTSNQSRYVFNQTIYESFKDTMFPESRQDRLKPKKCGCLKKLRTAIPVNENVCLKCHLHFILSKKSSISEKVKEWSMFVENYVLTSINSYVCFTNVFPCYIKGSSISFDFIKKDWTFFLDISQDNGRIMVIPSAFKDYFQQLPIFKSMGNISRTDCASIKPYCVQGTFIDRNLIYGASSSEREIIGDFLMFSDDQGNEAYAGLVEEFDFSIQNETIIPSNFSKGVVNLKIDNEYVMGFLYKFQGESEMNLITVFHHRNQRNFQKEVKLMLKDSEIRARCSFHCIGYETYYSKIDQELMKDYCHEFSLRNSETITGLPHAELREGSIINIYYRNGNRTTGNCLIRPSGIKSFEKIDDQFIGINDLHMAYGNSGAPIFDTSGALIGLHLSRIVDKSSGPQSSFSILSTHRVHCSQRVTDSLLPPTTEKALVVIVDDCDFSLIITIPSQDLSYTMKFSDDQTRRIWLLENESKIKVLNQSDIISVGGVLSILNEFKNELSVIVQSYPQGLSGELFEELNRRRKNAESMLKAIDSLKAEIGIESLLKCENADHEHTEYTRERKNETKNIDPHRKNEEYIKEAVNVWREVLTNIAKESRTIHKDNVSKINSITALESDLYKSLIKLCDLSMNILNNKKKASRAITDSMNRNVRKKKTFLEFAKEKDLNINVCEKFLKLKEMLVMVNSENSKIKKLEKRLDDLTDEDEDEAYNQKMSLRQSELARKSEDNRKFIRSVVKEMLPEIFAQMLPSIEEVVRRTMSNQHALSDIEEKKEKIEEAYNTLGDDDEFKELYKDLIEKFEKLNELNSNIKKFEVFNGEVIIERLDKENRRITNNEDQSCNPVAWQPVRVVCNMRTYYNKDCGHILHCPLYLNDHVHVCTKNCIMAMVKLLRQHQEDHHSEPRESEKGKSELEYLYSYNNLGGITAPITVCKLHQLGRAHTHHDSPSFVNFDLVGIWAEHRCVMDVHSAGHCFDDFKKHFDRFYKLIGVIRSDNKEGKEVYMDFYSRSFFLKRKLDDKKDAESFQKTIFFLNGLREKKLFQLPLLSSDQNSDTKIVVPTLTGILDKSCTKALPTQTVKQSQNGIEKENTTPTSDFIDVVDRYSTSFGTIDSKNNKYQSFKEDGNCQVERGCVILGTDNTGFNFRIVEDHFENTEGPCLIFKNEKTIEQAKSVLRKNKIFWPSTWSYSQKLFNNNKNSKNVTGRV